MSVHINEVTIQDGPLPTGPLVAYSYDPNTSCVFLLRLESNLAVPVNTSWGYIKDKTLNSGLVLHTLAPFPPPFYDATWYNPIDYVENSSYWANGFIQFASAYADSTTKDSMPDLSKVIKVIDDIHAKPIPSCYSLGLVTQETDGRKLLWRVFKFQHSTNSTPSYNYSMNTWLDAESAYLYKAGGMYFGGRDYSGPMNSVMLDPQDGVYGNSVTCRILDLNEFPINGDNETYVYAYTCNYNAADSKVYCVLNKVTGRLAEISAISRQTKYFTVVVPNDSEICQLYYTNRLMYTVRNTINNAFSLYDAHNNGVLLCTFDVGTFNPAVIPQFSVIN
jgi:hypothetical protein